MTLRPPAGMGTAMRAHPEKRVCPVVGSTLGLTYLIVSIRSART